MVVLQKACCQSAVVDHGFPVGGHGPVRGDVDLWCGHFLVKMYVKMKELGPVGGGVHQACPLDVPMVWELISEWRLRNSDSKSNKKDKHSDES